MNVLVVTGASRGIGAEIAKLGAERGYAVAVNYASDRAGAERVAAEIAGTGGKALAVHGDVAQEGDVVRLFRTAEQRLGPVAALVNNAGITGGFSRLESVTHEVLQRVMAVNVIGPMLCCREAVRRMSTRRGGSGGAIVTISSIAARLGGAGDWVHYAASKGAVDSMTIGLARETAEEGIRVNVVAAGLVETGLHAAMGQPDRIERMSQAIPMHRAAAPREIAEAALWLLSPAASYVTGAILDVGGGR